MSGMGRVQESRPAMGRASALRPDAGYASPVRKPRGRDIMAACGQLKSDSLRKHKAGRTA